MKTLITLERLREVLSYDPMTGHFVWLKTCSKRASAGSRAGTLSGLWYIIIHVDGHGYRAHRLAWFYMTGKWPTSQLDHVNLIRADNSWANLREATQFQNMANASKPITNTSGFKGVSWHKAAQKWCVQIRKEHKRHYIGLFTDPISAHEAYRNAAQRLHGEFARAD